MKALQNPPAPAALPKEWRAFLDHLVSYVAMLQPELDEIYQYQFFTPADFEWKGGTQAQKNIALRDHYYRKWTTACEMVDRPAKEILVRQYITDFGGIRKNSDATINRYVDDTDDELIDGRLDGVASWSKILSIRDPLAFAIYDARVAFSLNALQVRSADGLKVWFPLLATQNATLARVQRRFGLLRTGVEQIARKNTYRSYLTALTHVVGEGRPEDAEMILFAMAPSLAEEWERANPS